MCGRTEGCWWVWHLCVVGLRAVCMTFVCSDWGFLVCETFVWSDRRLPVWHLCDRTKGCLYICVCCSFSLMEHPESEWANDPGRRLTQLENLLIKMARDMHLVLGTKSTNGDGMLSMLMWKPFYELDVKDFVDEKILHHYLESSFCNWN